MSGYEFRPHQPAERVAYEKAAFEVGQKVVATMGYGSHAEVVSVPVTAAYAVPDRLSVEVAAGIPIEERNPDELLYATGREGKVRTAVEGVKAYYPAFDITPPHLITAIVTDKGIFPPTQLHTYLSS